MSNYAQIVNGVVVNVIVADADFIATQTNKTYVLCTSTQVLATLMTELDIFIAPHRTRLGYLDENHDWQPPTPMPVVEGKQYAWFEPNKQWIELA
jgi:hypothetical protein